LRARRFAIALEARQKEARDGARTRYAFPVRFLQTPDLRCVLGGILRKSSRRQHEEKWNGL
jgi:hypothetical protein